ncbi:terminase gpP N-terminus-related DNA-binding protein [Streptomyces gardneri]|uniref:terminase gpP N-terminus-related DNA-binding protein n=1 Tax=Streptomyces gardneri TaxID=66892 RepID=UPI003682BBD8
MLTREEDVDAHALRRQGWTISAIARHLGRNRKTIRAYLNGDQVAGQRRQSPDAFVPFLRYYRQRLADDPHLWASTLFDEVRDLGYEGGYSTFTRALRRYQVRPHCAPCHAATGRNVAVIAHPPGEEIQFDWLELPDAPESWGVGEHAHLLVGHSRIRAGGGRCWRSPRTSRTWSRPSIRWSARWAGPRGGSASTGWPLSVTPPAGRSPRLSLLSGSTTASESTSVRLVAVTARALSRRPTTWQPNAGGARFPTRWPSSRPSPASTSSPFA